MVSLDSTISLGEKHRREDVADDDLYWRSFTSPILGDGIIEELQTFDRCVRVYFFESAGRPPHEYFDSRPEIGDIEDALEACEVIHLGRTACA